MQLVARSVVLSADLVFAARAHAQMPPSHPAPIEPDGNDDPITETGTGTLPHEVHFERVGRPPHALTRIRDLRVHGEPLSAPHANALLDPDGAKDHPPARVPSGNAWE